MTASKPRRVRAGLIGAGIQASLTPAMHMAEGAQQGFDYQYELLDVSRMGAQPPGVAELLQRAESEGFAGVNVTHPFKQTVTPLLDELDPDAEALGAVNTVRFRDGRRTGFNTDWWGFTEGLRRGLPGVELHRVVQLGAGGAGAAVAYAVLRLGAERLELFDTDQSRAEDLARRLGQQFGPGRVVAGRSLAESMREADGLVHATPTGMTGYPGTPLDPELLQGRQWVAEIVYFPLQTELLRAARQKGCRTLDGGWMAVFQAVMAFELFTGVSPDADRMLQHFQQLLERRGEGRGPGGDTREPGRALA
jgi:shikimate dehydrogenase